MDEQPSTVRTSGHGRMHIVGTTAIVNSLPLPHLLVTLIDAGRWGVPADERVFDDVFSEHAGVTLYSIDQMKRETEWWRSLACEGSTLLGQRDRDRPPGDVEPSQFVLIGDVGVGLDSPFALDYRTSISDPRVIHFQWKPRRWVEIFQSFSAFAEQLDL